MTRYPEIGAREGARRYPWPVDLAVQALLVVGAALLYFRVRRLTEGGADEAIRALNAKDMDGRSLKVNEARPRN